MDEHPFATLHLKRGKERHMNGKGYDMIGNRDKDKWILIKYSFKEGMLIYYYTNNFSYSVLLGVHFNLVLSS